MSVPVAELLLLVEELDQVYPLPSNPCPLYISPGAVPYVAIDVYDDDAAALLYLREVDEVQGRLMFVVVPLLLTLRRGIDREGYNYMTKP